MKIAAILFLLFLFSCTASAQSKDSIRAMMNKNKNVSLLLGVAAGHFTFADIGVAVNTSGSDGVHPFASAYFISNEIKLDKNIVIGPKIGGWAAGGVSAMAMGVNLIYYTDFSNGSLVFRPEIGVGMGNFKIVYGYNLNITNKQFGKVNTNLVGFTYCLKMKKIR